MADYAHELGYWDSPINQWVEMGRHYVYAAKMGIEVQNYWFRVHGKRIVDIGGGPCSMLLQTWDAFAPCVVDPCNYPNWVRQRYEQRLINVLPLKGEQLGEAWPLGKVDEVWIYNVLQHVESPDIVIKNALAIGKTLRIFEWIDIPSYEGHPHMLTKAGLDEWIGADGETGIIHEPQWAMHGGKYYATVKEV